MSGTQSKAVQRYTFPGGRLGRNIIITGIIMALSSRREVLAPGSPLYDHIFSGRPKALKYAGYVQAFLFYFLFGAHAIETAIFPFTRLQKHGITFPSLAWFQWMAACFVGGKFTYEQFDGLVTGKSV
jgi:hypothetical protein